MSNVNVLQKVFLLVTAVGLTPIALSYGAAPERTLSWLFGIDATAVNVRHVFRAIMGLYLALASFWVAGAFSPRLRIPAMWSLVVFMIGLALGRILSIIVDGWPHPLLVGYTIVELVLAYAGWRLLNSSTDSVPAGRSV